MIAPTKIITVSLGMAVLVTLLGWKSVSSHAKTLRGTVQGSVRTSTPNGYEVSRIRQLIADTTQDILAFGDKIADIEATARNQEEDIVKIEKRLATNRADLAAERGFLADVSKQVFNIRGTSYSRQQVEASASARVAQIQRDAASLTARKDALERLRAAVVDGRDRMQSAMGLRDEKVQQLELLTADLANAELQRDLAALATPLQEGSLTRSHSELAESMKAFEGRVKDARRQVDATVGVMSTTPALIRHEGGASIGLLERIDAVLGE